VRLEIPSSGSFFEGHFPGRPILPAVALLDLALRALVTAGSPPALRGIANLRLRRPVTPGDVLDLQARAPAPEGGIRFEIRRPDENVADGVVLLGESSAIAAGAPARDLRPAPGSPDLDDLLPHRPPMRMVETIESETDDGVECAARVPAGSAFDSGGTAPVLVALEMAAQTAALFEALRRLRETGQAGARIGYLVGARDVGFGRARVPVGQAFRAAVRLSGMALPLSTYAFEVAQEGEVVASGTLSTWLKPTAA
jgi:predicted hotdog family 3-hydroxylacyl-ACP dehydratase